jgi:uncharacterized protein (UPF0335 family)
MAAGGGVNQQVKKLIQKLGEAIHESVAESESIAGVVKNIRDEGFDVLLMLEATIGLNEVEKDAAESTETEPVAHGPFTASDLSFLKSLRITTHEGHLNATDATLEPKAEPNSQDPS